MRTTEPQGQAAPSERAAVRLPRAFHGYGRTATDALIGELTARQAELERESASLRETVERLEQEVARHRNREQLIGKTLLAAMSHATTIREAARREADLALRKSRTEVDRRTAHAEAIERDRADTERELLRLRRLANDVQSGLESFLTQALHQLRPEAEKAPEAAPAPAEPVASAPPSADGQEPLVEALEETLKVRSLDSRSGSGAEAPRPRP